MPFFKNVKNTPLLLKIHHGDIFQNTTQKSTFPYLGHEFRSILKSYIWPRSWLVHKFVTFLNFWDFQNIIFDSKVDPLKIGFANFSQRVLNLKTIKNPPLFLNPHHKYIFKNATQKTLKSIPRSRILITFKIFHMTPWLVKVWFWCFL